MVVLIESGGKRKRVAWALWGTEDSGWSGVTALRKQKSAQGVRLVERRHNGSGWQTVARRGGIDVLGEHGRQLLRM